MAGLQLPKRQVIPSSQDLGLRCGNCGHMEFKVHVRPHHQAARVTELICLKCVKYFKVDEYAYIEGDGKAGLVL